MFPEQTDAQRASSKGKGKGGQGGRGDKGKGKQAGKGDAGGRGGKGKGKDTHAGKGAKGGKGQKGERLPPTMVLRRAWAGGAAGVQCLGRAAPVPAGEGRGTTVLFFHGSGDLPPGA